MEANGVELGVMNMLLLKKIEELTLYTLEQEKAINQLQMENGELKIQQEESSLQLFDLLNRVEKLENNN